MAPRTVHCTPIGAADTRQKVPGWRHSGPRVVGRPPEDDSPASLLADAMRRTRQARVVRTDPLHPWHWLARAQAAHKAGDHRKALAVLLANEGDPSFHAAIEDKVMDVREAAYRLDGSAGVPTC
jgi:hypothetical protein